MITTKKYRPFAVLLLLDTAAFLLQKFASAHAQGEGFAYYKSLLLHPWVWLALALGPVQLWLWTRILRNTDLSLAYPLTSLSYPLTMFCAMVFFQEHLLIPVWIGGGLITLGVGLLAEPEPHVAGEPEPVATNQSATSEPGDQP